MLNRFTQIRLHKKDKITKDFQNDLKIHNNTPLESGNT